MDSRIGVRDRDQDHTRWLWGPHNRTFFKCGVVRTCTPPPQFICMLFFNILKKILEIYLKKKFQKINKKKVKIYCGKIVVVG